MVILVIQGLRNTLFKERKMQAKKQMSGSSHKLCGWRLEDDYTRRYKKIIRRICRRASKQDWKKEI